MTYVIDLDKFGIKSNNTAPIETATGINNALQYAKQNGFTKVIMPFGEYCVSENIPIVMVDNIALDLNQSTFKINPNGKQKSTIVNFTACKDAKLINGTLLGDRYQHDYKTISGSHEWNCAVTFNDCEYCSLDNVVVKGVAGYGVFSTLGKNISDLIIGVTTFNIQIGGISDNGLINNNTNTIRTIKPMNISKTGKEFELGYNKGFMGYPYMASKIYDSFFYDKDMNFISSTKLCKQYKKVEMPVGAVFVHFVFYQSYVPIKGDADFNSTTVFLTNYKSPYKANITNCSMEDNRCLGMALCGGRDFLIESNTFNNNRGGAPNYAIDMEDGWEYMDKFVFKNNNFVNNANDVVICAGDNVLFEDNHFTSTVYMYARTTNYKFVNNKFENIISNINYEYSTDTICTGNTYTNCKIAVTKKNLNCKITLANEKLINTNVNYMSIGDELTNSIVTSDSTFSIRLAGAYRKCSVNCKKGDYISASLYNCNIQGTILNCQGDTMFKGCTLINSFGYSTSNTKSIKANNCIFTDSNLSANTWAAGTIIEVKNCEINMLNGTNSIINISAGKMANLVFINNKIVNQISRPVFSMYDTSYTVPNGNATIKGNSFTLTKYAYIFDGVNIISGIFNFTAKDNTIQGAVMLNPRYINNKYFIIK